MYTIHYTPSNGIQKCIPYVIEIEDLKIDNSFLFCTLNGRKQAQIIPKSSIDMIHWETKVEPLTLLITQ